VSVVSLILSGKEFQAPRSAHRWSIPMIAVAVF